MVAQLCLIYTSTGLHKLGAPWTPVGGFSALYWVYQDPTWVRFDGTWAAWLDPVLRLATACTWVFEIGALFFLVTYVRLERSAAGPALRQRPRDLRRYFTAIGVSLHFGILLTLNVGPFPWISFAYYLCLWRPDELEGLVRRAIGRVAGWQSRAPSLF